MEQDEALVAQPLPDKLLSQTGGLPPPSKLGEFIAVVIHLSIHGNMVVEDPGRLLFSCRIGLNFWQWAFLDALG